MASSRPDFRHLDALLRAVSRSFYLSIRLLPHGVRPAVGVAYLLARATDSLADTSNAPASERLQGLSALAEAIRRVDTSGVAAISVAFAGRQGNPAERELLQRLPECVALLQALEPADHADVQTVLASIVHGQQLDLTRFPGGGAPAALPDATALHEYTYLVAGCVGEFWTDLCGRHVPSYADRPLEQLRELGCAFGCGLQLVNIVRDVGEDLPAGRCYLPADEIAAAGLGIGTLLGQADAFLPIWQRWQALAAADLDDGMQYALALRSRRMRAAVALPALLGMRTLALLAQAGTGGLRTRVKVPRRQVHALLLRIALTFAAPEPLREDYQAARARAQAGWDNPGR
jgi:farnesyl-diphosphate farnesyltransferase